MGVAGDAVGPKKDPSDAVAPKKALGRDPPGRNHLSDDVVGRRKDIPCSEPQNPIALLDEFNLAPTIRSECVAVGVVSLSVEFDRSDVAGAPAVEPGGQWTALGRVGHWGHTHTRVNRYTAQVTVTAEAADTGARTWKITGLQVTEARRL